VWPLLDPGVQRVALVRPRVGLGDWLCTLPALRVLRAARPDLRVTVVTYPEMAPLLDRVPDLVDGLLAFPGHLGIPERPIDIAGWPAFLTAARRHGFDLAIQAYGDRPGANAVTESIGAARVGGFAPRGFRPTRDVEMHIDYPVSAHEAWRHLRLVEHLGARLPPRLDPQRLMALPVWPDERDRFAALAAAHGLVAGSYAVLHPGASAPTRRWAPERYARVADALARRGLRVVLGGVEAERDLTGRVAGLMSVPSVDLAGRTSLGAYALLLAGAAVLVSGDTGAAHLAAASGTRSVTLFLAGDPLRWAYPPPRHRAARAGVSCSPCPYLRCPLDLRCAERLSVSQVLSELDAVLSRADSEGASRGTAAGEAGGAGRAQRARANAERTERGGEQPDTEG
jgi:ADP-heptose:LPS heptosyltransferase